MDAYETGNGNAGNAINGNAYSAAKGESSSLESSLLDLPSSGRRWVPDDLISEDGKGDVVFSKLALLAPSDQRALAKLHFEQWIREKRLVGAMRWREVTSMYLPGEVSRAEEIVHGRATVISEERKMAEAFGREQKKGNPDPLELDRLEARLCTLRPLAEEVRAKIISAGERVLECVKVLERIAIVERKARGWKLKAQRQTACGQFAWQWKGDCGLRFFQRSYCRNRYCPHCGPRVHQELLAKSLRLEKLVATFLEENPRYRLRILDITAVTRAEKMPSAADVRKFGADVKALINRINRLVAGNLGVPRSKKLTGYIYCKEFGFENNNLHCHGVLLSPFIEQEWLSKQWREIRADGSFRVYIAEARSFETAMRHSLEYTGKFAAPGPDGFDPERAFALELAFAGCRRVDTLGWFFNRLPAEDEEVFDLHCPCGAPGCFLKLDSEAGLLPVIWFEEHGIRDLDEVRDRGSPHSEVVGASWVN